VQVSSLQLQDQELYSFCQEEERCPCQILQEIQIPELFRMEMGRG